MPQKSMKLRWLYRHAMIRDSTTYYPNSNSIWERFPLAALRGQTSVALGENIFMSENTGHSVFSAGRPFHFNFLGSFLSSF